MRAANLTPAGCVPGLVLGLALALAPALGAESLPERLSQTGLYADIASKQVAPELLAFTPQYPLWSDGARKRRWISLPVGAHIDASDPDAWVFPVGTRVWKEFAFARRVETRFIELTAEGWIFATYRWLPDESDALLAPKLGEPADFELSGGSAYDLPARFDCRACHEGNVARLLGFSALQLSSARDPGALHGEAPRPGDVDLSQLVARDLVRGLPAELVASPPRIAAATPTERAALGYLHGNCSNCHNDRGPLAELDFSLEVRIAPGAPGPGALRTAVGQAAHFQPSGAQPMQRLAPGHPEASLVAQRMSRRDPISEMPPLGSRLVDREAVALVETWIREGLFTQHKPQSASKEGME